MLYALRLAVKASCQPVFGFQVRNHSLDPMDLTLHLIDDDAFIGRVFLSALPMRYPTLQVTH